MGLSVNHSAFPKTMFPTAITSGRDTTNIQAAVGKNSVGVMHVVVSQNRQALLGDTH